MNLDEAIRAALTVGEIEVCSDPTSLAKLVPPPRDPEAVRRLDGVRQELDRVAALRRAGMFETGLTQARKLVAEARGLGHAPVMAEAFFRSAQLEGDLGRWEASIDILYDAFRVANEAHDDVLAATTLRTLLHTMEMTGAHREEIDLVWKVAEAAVARAPQNEDLVADLLATQGVILSNRRKHSEAAERLRRAVAIKERLHGADDLEVAKYLVYLAHCQDERHDASIAISERALAIFSRTLGPEHPNVALILRVIAYALYEKGDYEGAIRNAQRSLAIDSKVLPDSPRPAYTLELVALIRMDQERDDEAQVLQERAVHILEQADGRDDFPLARAHALLADLAARRGDTETARRFIDDVLRVMKKIDREDHGTVALAMITLGDVFLQEKSLARARAAYDQALAILQKKEQDQRDVATAMTRLGELALADGKPSEAIRRLEQAKELFAKKTEAPEHPRLVPIMTSLGRAYRAAGRPAEAEAILEQAIAIADRHGESTRFSGARARFQLARALWESSAKSRARQVRASELARTATDALSGRQEAPEVKRWLRKHQLR